MKNNKAVKALNNMVNLWERLELRLNKEGNDATFVTRIENIDREALTIENPVRIAGNLDIAIGQNIEVVFNRDDASYTFNAVVVSIDNKRENITTIKALSDIKRSQRRKFVRIDISGEVTFKAIEFAGADQVQLSLDKKGELLNISAGGVLIDTKMKLRQDDLVLLNFWLKNNQRLENILGLVKRLEGIDDASDEDQGYIAGIEFLTKEKINSKHPGNVTERLPVKVNFFSDALQQAIVQFVYRQQVENRKKAKVKQ